MEFSFKTNDMEEALLIVEALRGKAEVKVEEKAEEPMVFPKVPLRNKNFAPLSRSTTGKRYKAKQKYLRLKGHRIPYKKMLGVELQEYVLAYSGKPAKDIFDMVLKAMLPYVPNRMARKRINHNIHAFLSRQKRMAAPTKTTPLRLLPAPIQLLSESRPEPDREYKEAVLKGVGSQWRTGINKSAIINRIMAMLRVNEEVATNQYLLLRREGHIMENEQGKVKLVYTYKRKAKPERTLETAAEGV